jgi:hypothetical protein
VADRFVYAMCRARWPGRDAQSYHRKIDRLRLADLRAVGVAVFDDYDDADAGAIRRILHEAVDQVLFNENRLDVARFELRDRSFVLTGGLVPDNEPDVFPTESFVYVKALEVSRVTLVRDEQQGRYRRPRDDDGEPTQEAREALERLGALLGEGNIRIRTER